MMKETLNTKGGGLLLVSIPQIMITTASMIKSGFIMKTLFVLSFLLFLSQFSLAWGPDVRLTYNDSASTTPLNNGWKIAASPSGMLHVVWMDTRDKNQDNNYEIYYKRWNGALWEPDTRLSFDTLNSAVPSVAADHYGNVHVVWSNWQGASGRITYRKWDGVGWDPPVVLNPPPVMSGDAPSVATDTLGRVHVVWQGIWRGGEIFYRMWNGASWDTITRLTNDSINSWKVSVACSPSGDVHLVWEDDRDGNHPEIYYKRRTGFVWGPDTRLTADTASSVGPAIAADVSGNVHVVWYDYRLGLPQIYYKRWNGTQWDPDVRISTNLSSYDRFPSIAVDDSGRVHVVWTDDVMQVYYRSWNGSIWEPVVPLGDLTSPKFYSSIATDHRNGLHVVWSDLRDGNSEIYYKRGGTTGLQRGDLPGSDAKKDCLLAYPSPFRAAVQIEYTLKQPSYVHLKVYNMAGQLVGHVLEGHREVGFHRERWNGKDIHGKEVPAGLYFVILQSDGVNYRTRLTKVK
jgi:hypothetical protein